MASSFPPPPQFAAAPRRAFLFGESSIMNCLNVSGSTLLGTGDKNYVGWFNRLAGQPLSFSASNFYGELSNSTQLLAALQANVLAKLANFDIIFMAPLGNDVVTGVPAATSLANLKAMILPLLAAGKWVVLTAALPGNSSFFSANQGKQQVYLNQKVREWVRAFPSNVPFFLLDPWRDVGDPASALGYFSTQSGIQDGADPGPAGGYLIGKRLYNLIGGFLPPAPNYASALADVYDATYNPTGNLLGAAGYIGTLTGGTNDGSLGGALAAGWWWNKIAGSFTSAMVVGSTAANPAGFNAPPGGAQTITVNIPAGNTNSEDMQLGCGVNNFAVGDTVYGEAEITLSNVANLWGFGVVLWDLNNNIQSADGSGGAIADKFYPGDYPRLLYQTPPQTIAAGCAFMALRVVAIFDASGASAATATIKVAGACVRKVLA